MGKGLICCLLLFLVDGNVSVDDYYVDGYTFPVGNPKAKGYYNAQPFGKNNHLGDDWNAVTGGNTDLGDPIYSIANGKVSFADDIGSGWGNVIRVIHYEKSGECVESLYAHCDSIFVKKGEWVKRGEQIGTIGNADGQYYAHLHFEIRSDTLMTIGSGYAVAKKVIWTLHCLFVQNNNKLYYELIYLIKLSIIFESLIFCCRFESWN